MEISCTRTFIFHTTTFANNNATQQNIINPKYSFKFNFMKESICTYPPDFKANLKTT